MAPNYERWVEFGPRIKKDNDKLYFHCLDFREDLKPLVPWLFTHLFQVARPLTLNQEVSSSA